MRARLQVTPISIGEAPPLTVQEAAARLGVSTDWIRDRFERVPGTLIIPAPPWKACLQPDADPGRGLRCRDSFLGGSGLTGQSPGGFCVLVQHRLTLLKKVRIRLRDNLRRVPDQSRHSFQWRVLLQ